MPWQYQSGQPNTTSQIRHHSSQTPLMTRNQSSSTSVDMNDDVFQELLEEDTNITQFTDFSVRLGSEAYASSLVSEGISLSYANQRERRNTMHDRPLPDVPRRTYTVIPDKACSKKDKPAPPPPSYPVSTGAGAGAGAKKQKPPRAAVSLPHRSNSSSSTSCSCSSPHGNREKTNGSTFVILVTSIGSFICACTAAGFALYTFATLSQAPTMQVYGTGPSNTTSAHVKIFPDPSMFNSETFSEGANFTMSMSIDLKDRTHLENVGKGSKNLYIMTTGWYFVYSSITFTINELKKDCNELRYKTWMHKVVMLRENQLLNKKRYTPLLRTERTCCKNCKEFRSSGFTGGVFHLEKTDMIQVFVSAPPIVLNDAANSYLGLFLVDGDVGVVDGHSQGVDVMQQN